MKRICTIMFSVILLFSFVTAVVYEVNVQRTSTVATVAAAPSNTYSISTIQKKLKSWGYYTGAVDGISGTRTVNAIKAFQRKNGLTADGIVGTATAKAMGLSTPTVSGTTGTGKDVVSVSKYQQKLKDWGYYNGAVDGVKGKGTTKAVKTFQQKNGLTADGVVGVATAKAMGLGTTNTGYSNNDEHLLAKAVYSEARGEPYVGQVAIAAVVLNRVKSSKFPNTVAGVIYQPWAFTAVNDGQFDLEPNATARQAARDALNGWDPTYGSIYYYNPVTATSSWIFSRKTTTTIGRHVFAI